MSCYLIQLHLSKRKFFTDVLKGLLFKPGPLCFIKIMRNMICYLKVHGYLKLNFSG